MGHLKHDGCGAALFSGAISKTVNMPEDATVDEVEEAYLEAWKLGPKQWQFTAMAANAPSR